MRNRATDDSVTEMEAFLGHFPETETVEFFITDANGIQRGKRVPASRAAAAVRDGIFLQRSAFCADIWSNDVEATGLIFELGDPDTACFMVPGSLCPVPWLERPAAQAMLVMQDEDGRPFHADPREVLRRVEQRYREAGLQPVVATEIEFNLCDAHRADSEPPSPPISASRGQPLNATQMFGISELHELDAFFAELEHVCGVQGIPADALIAEHGPAQYEINLCHVPNAVLAADYTVLLKRAIKGVALRHGMEATFMAKPYADHAGNGFHVHMSVCDETGGNLFASDRKDGEEKLKWAISGVLRNMADSMAILAPNINSYRRFQPGSYAPMTPVWGYDNRTLAVRVPRASAENARLEHRVAGADANPHLVVAAVLAGVHAGLTERIDPGEPTRGNAYEQKRLPLPNTWNAALDAFEASAHVEEYFGREYRAIYGTCKRQELEVFGREISPLEYASYLRSV